MEQGSRAVCSSDSEVDLLFLHQGRRLGFAVKFSEAPRLTASMRSAAEQLKLDHLWVVYPGAHEFPMAEGITALPLQNVTRWGRERCR
jgi:predicted AAA+ superfamily ATPase